MQLQSLIFPLIIVLFAVPLFLQARKQKRTMQEQQKLQNSLVAGDRVMTTSGVFGTIVSTSDDSVDLEIAPGMTTTWVRAAIREKVNTDSSDNASSTEIAEEEPAETKAEVAEPIEQQKAN